MTIKKDLKLDFKKFRDLRYGENPHQNSAFFIDEAKPGFEQLWGIELSHNNIADAHQAWKLVGEFSEPTLAIVKHANPCGLASRKNLVEAFDLAFGADSISAFGGIIALNVPPTLDLIEAMRGKFFELIIAPNYSNEVLERLKKRSAKMRVVRAEKLKSKLELARAFGGYLVQTADDIKESRKNWKIVSGVKPSAKIMDDLEFAWKVCKHVKSNAVVIAKDQTMLGMGTGQPNRVNSTMLALRQAQGGKPDEQRWAIKKDKKTIGAVLASDAFFPFADNVKLAAMAGITTIVQPGGSIRDEEVIAEAKKLGITMVFTGIRHFRH
jgi:phosphoribosylaminoimidazolecarboxamide formyltransferase/IMP cyclohydrolase